MILLILDSLYKKEDEELTLNSIMILLILCHCQNKLAGNIDFKFHYDSINSRDRALIEFFYSSFKFHYDSINSR